MSVNAGAILGHVTPRKRGDAYPGDERGELSPQAKQAQMRLSGESVNPTRSNLARDRVFRSGLNALPFQAAQASAPDAIPSINPHPSSSTPPGLVSLRPAGLIFRRP
jgi:hypothetical protein